MVCETVGLERERGGGGVKKGRQTIYKGRDCLNIRILKKYNVSLS